MLAIVTLTDAQIQQLITAVIAAVVLIIGAGGVFVVALFRLFQQRMNARETEREQRVQTFLKEKEAKLRAQEIEYQRQLSLIKTEAEQDKTNNALYMATVENNKQMIEILKDYQRQNAEQVATQRDIAEILDVMRTVGTKTEQETKEMLIKFDANGTKPVRDLRIQFDNLSKEIKQQIGTDGNITRIVFDIQQQLGNLEVKVSDAIRHKTQPLPAITDPPPATS